LENDLREKITDIEKRLQSEREESKRKSEQLQKQINDLHIEVRDEVRSAGEIVKQYEKKLKDEKELLTQQFTREIENIKEIYTKHNGEVVGILSDHLSKRNDEIDQLNQDIKILYEQFRSSSDGFMTYFKQKPQNDIKIPEHLRQVIEKAQRDLKLDTKNFYNIAFVGHTKTGKSSLINAIRGIEDDEPGAAEVGSTEVTNLIEPYTFKEHDLRHVKIYDVPGAGTLTHNAESYYQDKCLCAFDCLIIVTQDALAKDEIDFALQSIKFNQPIAFVRSRFDIAMDNQVKSRKISEINQHTIKNEVAKCAKAFTLELDKMNEPELKQVPIFFVSAYVLRELMIQKTKPNVMYQEKSLLDYIKAKSKYSRNIIDC
jgi:ribosome biogenesis GTPase A